MQRKPLSEVTRPVQPVNLNHQQGQALIYGIFVLVGGLAALFFLFNTGQLSEEKTKLVNTADAVAYSAGVMHARALNFSAYSNRALVANEVLVAQMVSLSSWAQYAQNHAENLSSVFPECADSSGRGAVGGAVINYSLRYASSCFSVVQYAGEVIAELAAEVPHAAQAVVDAVELSKAAIAASQKLVYSPLFIKARADLMQEVADANYVNDGTVTVEPLHQSGPESTMTDEWRSFTSRYAGEDRARFAETARLAAYSNQFIKARSWTERGATPPPAAYACFRPTLHNEVRRRGGTELINYDEWKAEDTESFWKVTLRTRKFRPPSCSIVEVPIAWGEQQAHPPELDQDESSAYLGGSPSTNRGAHARASSEEWTNYTGLPGFYDLATDVLVQKDPRLKFTVRLARPVGQTKTSEARSPIAVTPRLNAYQAKFASNAMLALASSEVFFDRPFDERANHHGKNRGKPQEIGSLFNPYWQVRLIQPSNVDIENQQRRQGAVLLGE